MFVISKRSTMLKSWIYLCNSYGTNDGATFELDEAHTYKTAEGAWRAAEKAGPQWEVYEVYYK